ncbi:ImmA/IrrE family metallo-endopeptidase [Rarobacter incanus]|uniref:Uncharacterized protein DUF955 n=1 Tax=Rarobacter incanus TaxID=153494 RepID=A0A542SN02_9MICO|nr:ImmA/IrrE family metallo-endopeptidase [Rarobacter incanus]TQK76011.1 uncharacterized protein DUF955 [Rarobacter incanus]
MGYEHQGRLDFDATPLEDPSQITAGEPADFTAESAQASIDALVSGTSTFSDPADFRDLIRFAAQFRGYSPFNRMLIQIQDRGAHFVATDAVWKRRFNRRVRSDARAIVLLQPRGPVLIVFDVRGTEPIDETTPALPPEVVNPTKVTYCMSEGELFERWMNTIHNAARDGIRVTLADQATCYCGSARYIGMNCPEVVTRQVQTQSPKLRRTERFQVYYEVTINKNLPLKDQYSTLVHELAHIFCGHTGTHNAKLWPDRSVMPHEVVETEAESVAHMLLFKIDSNVQMGDYLQGHLDKEGRVPPGVSLNAMMRAAGEIERMGNGHLTKRRDPKDGK